MMPGTFLQQGMIGGGTIQHDGSLLSVLTALGLTSGLQICLDAGDAASYDATVDVQLWRDRSGNDLHFYRGTTSGSQSSDPTFNGTAGNKSANEYFSFDGGDVLTINQSNPASINGLHKDGSIFSFMSWFRTAPSASSGFSNLWGTVNATSTGAGINCRVEGGSAHVFDVRVAPLAVSGDAIHGTAMANSTWNMLSFAIDENAGANNCNMGVNKIHELKTVSYSTPASGNATQPMQIGGRGNNEQLLSSGTRVAAFALWSGRRLSPSEIDAIYDELSPRFS